MASKASDNSGSGPTLADYFMKNKKKMVEKYEHQMEKDKVEEKKQKSGRSKEEILKLRKEMMKPNYLKKEYKTEASGEEQKSEDLTMTFQASKGGKGGPNPELMSRLAAGKKVKV